MDDQELYEKRMPPAGVPRSRFKMGGEAKWEGRDRLLREIHSASFSDSHDEPEGGAMRTVHRATVSITDLKWVRSSLTRLGATGKK